MSTCSGSAGASTCFSRNAAFHFAGILTRATAHGSCAVLRYGSSDDWLGCACVVGFVLLSTMQDSIYGAAVPNRSNSWRKVRFEVSFVACRIHWLIEPMKYTSCFAPAISVIDTVLNHIRQPLQSAPGSNFGKQRQPAPRSSFLLSRMAETKHKHRRHSPIVACSCYFVLFVAASGVETLFFHVVYMISTRICSSIFACAPASYYSPVTCDVANNSSVGILFMHVIFIYDHGRRSFQTAMEAWRQHENCPRNNMRASAGPGLGHLLSQALRYHLGNVLFSITLRVFSTAVFAVKWLCVNHVMQYRITRYFVRPFVFRLSAQLLQQLVVTVGCVYRCW